MAKKYVSPGSQAAAEAIKNGESVNADSPTGNSLSALSKDEREITLNNETFVISEWRMQEIGKISQSFAPLIGTLINLSPEDFGNQMMLMAVLMSQADLTNGLLAFSINKPIEFVQKAKLSEGAKASVELITLNKDFFLTIFEMFKGMGVQG